MVGERLLKTRSIVLAEVSPLSVVGSIAVNMGDSQFVVVTDNARYWLGRETRENALCALRAIARIGEPGRLDFETITGRMIVAIMGRILALSIIFTCYSYLLGSNMWK